jgi:tRNA threonylcarbamoyl adenosine modification protein (Sua5/YciO/YrdC/YwlC family)
MPIAVLVADPDQAWSLVAGAVPDAARRLAARLWPGPLTLVLPAVAGGTIGVRCPDHDLVRRLARRVGPLPTTSANRHGAPTPPTAAEAAAALAAAPHLVIDGGPCATVASTVVDVTSAEPVVLRAGAIDSAGLAAALTFAAETPTAVPGETTHHGPQQDR